MLHPRTKIIYTKQLRIVESLLKLPRPDMKRFMTCTFSQVFHGYKVDITLNSLEEKDQLEIYEFIMRKFKERKIYLEESLAGETK
jgi:hypothetical protein